MAVVETHATAYVQKTIARNDEGSGIVWGNAVDNRTWSGVALLYAKRSAWSVRRIPCLNHNAQRFEQAGRLMAVQIWRGKSQHSVVMYNLYGKSGGRTEASKKQYNQELIREVHRDSVMRGDVATVICGDFNMEISDAHEEFSALFNSRWKDAAHWGATGFDSTITSTKGKGARIDMAFLNHTLATYMRSYSVVFGLPQTGHDVVRLVIGMPCSSQTWYMVKNIGEHGDYQKPLYLDDK